MLDASSPLPLYHQLAEELYARIRDGEYLPGARIPSEHELAAAFKLGRPTVRQATDSLIQRGMLVRRRGSGTYVRSVPTQVDLFSLAGTLVSFEAQGIHLTTELPRKPVLAVIDERGHPLHGREAARVVRVSRVDGQPVLLEEIDLDAAHFPGFTKLPLQNRSLSELVEGRYRLRAYSAEQSFRVTVLDRLRAGWLELATGTPLLSVERTLHFPRAEGAIFARMHCRTDRFAFSQRIGGHHHA